MLTENEKFKLANDTDFYDAIMDAEDGKPPLQKSPFKTIGDRMRLITELEKRGFVITKVTKC